MDRPESPTELIARISAEHDSQFEATGRHRLPAAVVTRDAPTKQRTSVRRLAPLAVGAAVMLVATVVITVVKPTDDVVASPELSTALAHNTPATTEPPTTSATPPPPTSAPPVATSAPKPVVPPKVNANAPAAPPKPAAPPVGGSGGNGTQAATAKGWTLVDSDEFNGSSLSGKWGPYDGAGHNGNGRRTRDSISVGGGLLTINGDAGGNTGGMAWNDNQTYGKWEVRAKFPKGDGNYHPVLLLWPQDGWPPEVDFAETTSDSSDVGFYLHYSSSNQQVSASKQLDLTQWHNYAVEWVDGRVTGYIDGVQWFQSTDGKTVPSQPMHLAIQLDNFGGVKQQTQMLVDYVRIYK
ncbi:glycoside hydrolase family 16 protein [Pseudonocardia sp. GCM10023141]|uniref:glycoside hydrolase family 16 protein n=1 Tax=Pseudonocardia sp. GCM10023141 TaxID=3252653 RepID=UPI0036202780